MDAIIAGQSADMVRAMGRHLHALQLEDAELLSSLIANKTAALLVRAATDILKVLGILEDAKPPEPDPNETPDDAEVIQMAEALLRRHTSPRRRR